MDLIQGYTSGSSSNSNSQSQYSQQVQVSDTETPPSTISDENEAGSSTTTTSQVEIKNARKMKQLKRNSGQSYVTKDGKLVESRKMKPLEKCRNDCRSKVSFEDQTRIFNSYWQNGSYEHRFSYVSSHILLQVKKRVRQRTEEKLRKFTVFYHLDSDGHQIRVCKKCFTSTLGETDAFCNNAIKKCWLKINQSLGSDEKAKHVFKNISPLKKLEKSSNHIATFPADKNHESEAGPSTTITSQVEIKNARKMKQLKRNSGQSYVTKEGKLVESRKMKPLEKCRSDCRLKISLEDQTRIFNSYWQNGSYKHRFNYVSSRILLQDKKRRRTQSKGEKLRKFTVLYHLDSEGHRITVCKKCFMSTLGETDAFCKNVVDKSWLELNQALAFDNRGKHAPKNKSPPEKLEEISNHIAKFPVYESHCYRSHTRQKYLPSGLNVKKMHQMYSEEVVDPLSVKMYRQVFSKTGLKFKRYQLDTCPRCDDFDFRLNHEINDDKKLLISLQKELHQNEAESAYNQKKLDIVKAKDSDGTCVLLTLHLQPCLPTPLLNSSIAFYKRSLWVYNVTIHSLNSATKCYMWDEVTGKRGGNEISSCLYKHLSNIDANVKHVICYSDCCPGQNKNRIIAAMFSAFVSNHPSIEALDQKFLEPGHTHMDCDLDFTVTAKAKKTYGTEIQHPYNWYDCIRQAKVNDPFEVIEMSQADFYKFEDLYSSSFTMPTQNEEKEKFYWTDVKWIRYTKEQGVLYYKTSFSDTDDFLKLDLRKCGKSSFILESRIKLSYDQPLPLNKEKHQDLLYVLPLLRPEIVGFYENLQSNANIQLYDPDLDDLAENEEIFEIGLEVESNEITKTKKNTASNHQELPIDMQVKENAQISELVQNENVALNHRVNSNSQRTSRPRKRKRNKPY